MYPEGNEGNADLPSRSMYTLLEVIAHCWRVSGKSSKISIALSTFLGNNSSNLDWLVCVTSGHEYFRVLKVLTLFLNRYQRLQTSDFPAKALAYLVLLHLRTIDILGWMILCWGRRVLYVWLGSTSGFLEPCQPLLEVINTLPQITMKPLPPLQYDHPPPQVGDYWLGLS